MRRIVLFLLCLSLPLIPVRGAEAPKYVALTFDDGPSGEHTRRLLAGLEQRGVQATFFLCGYRLETYGQLAGEIRAGGHEIGLHGYSHDDLSRMSAGEILRELEATRALLPNCLVNLLRTPGGHLTDPVREAAGKQNLSIVHWSLDPKDWATDSAEVIQSRILENVADGDIILLHDMSDSSVTAALNVIDRLRAEGYQFLTVSQLALLRLKQLSPGSSYRSFPGQNVNLS